MPSAFPLSSRTHDHVGSQERHGDISKHYKAVVEETVVINAASFGKHLKSERSCSGTYFKAHTPKRYGDSSMSLPPLLQVLRCCVPVLQSFLASRFKLVSNFGPCGICEDPANVGWSHSKSESYINATCVIGTGNLKQLLDFDAILEHACEMYANWDETLQFVLRECNRPYFPV